MKKKYIQILIFINFILLFSPGGVLAQKPNKGNVITVESVVKDAKGNPIEGAIIYGNEGKVVAKTDASGAFKISIPEQTDLLIESDGYEPLYSNRETLKFVGVSIEVFPAAARRKRRSEYCFWEGKKGRFG